MSPQQLQNGGYFPVRISGFTPGTTAYINFSNVGCSSVNGSNLPVIVGEDGSATTSFGGQYDATFYVQARAGLFGGPYTNCIIVIFSGSGATAIPNTPTPTSTPTSTPVTPTNTPTSTPTSTPVTPTNTPTSIPTSTPVTPTNTPTTEPTATATTEPTATPTNVPIENGAVVVTLVTEDGSEIPDNTIVCLDLDCRNLNAIVSTNAIVAAVPSGTTIAFTDVTPGDHLISVTVNGALAASETVTVAPGATTNVTIVLPAADATPNIIVNPPGSGRPVDPDGNDDGDGSGDGGSTDGGSSGGGNVSAGGSGAAPVTSLPSTGTGDETSASMLIVLLGGLLLIASGLALRSRRV